MGNSNKLWTILLGTTGTTMRNINGCLLVQLDGEGWPNMGFVYAEIKNIRVLTS